MKRALILQHVDRDSPGRFLDFFSEDDIVPEYVKLWAGEEIPDLSAYDLMFVLGGPQDVWEEDRYPWLAMEKEVIREWVRARAKPFMGVCLGHQLLCDALGGVVGLCDKGEHGIADVKIASGYPLVNGLLPREKVVQWHMAEVKELPCDIDVLASSDSTAVQMLGVDRHAVTTQFHSECSPQTFAAWTATPGYIALFEKHRGPGAYVRFTQQAYPLMHRMNEMSRQIYDNLVTATGLRR